MYYSFALARSRPTCTREPRALLRAGSPAKGRPQYAERPSGIKSFRDETPLGPGVAILGEITRAAYSHLNVRCGIYLRVLFWPRRVSGKQRRTAVGEFQVDSALVPPQPAERNGAFVDCRSGRDVAAGEVSFSLARLRNRLANVPGQFAGCTRPTGNF